MSDFFVAPGTILKEYMDSRGISQKELAKITESSERHISHIINGKVKITAEFALKLEKVFNDVQALFWLNLENEYQLFLLREETLDIDTPRLEDIAQDYQFDYVFKGMGYSIEKKAKRMLDLLGVNSFEEAHQQLANQRTLFMEDKGKVEAKLVWLKLCEEEVFIQNDINDLLEYDQLGLKNSLPTIKRILNSKDLERVFDNIRKVLNKNGILFVVLESLPNAKIRGATTMYEGRPVIYLSTLYKKLDYIYFALIHEIYHLVNDDLSKTEEQLIISYEEDNEQKINDEARSFFIKDSNSYEKLRGKKEKNEEDIFSFSKENGVIVDITVGFLQRDKVISYDKFTNLRTFLRKEE